MNDNTGHAKFWWSLVLLGVLFASGSMTGCSGSADSRRGDAAADPGLKGTQVPEPILFYVGSSDGNLENPVFLVELDAERERFSVIDSFGGAKGTSYLAASPGKKFLYSIDKTVSDPATGEMSVVAFRAGLHDHRLEYLNRQSSQGAGPCHVHCSSDGRYLFTANYNSGQIAAFPVGKDGYILPASSVVRGEGSGPVRGRQEGPHAHYVTLDPKERFLLSPDLGTDRVLIYRFDSETGKLSPNPAQEFLELRPGSGPRHLVFHTSGNFVYVVNELNATVTACIYDENSGTLEILNTESTVTETHEGAAYPAAIRIHPLGKFLYASTRGEQSSITVFRIAPDGSISRLQVTGDVPGWPRDFNIDPAGEFLVAAGERADEIGLYLIDRENGFLKETGVRTSIISPACILFINPQTEE
jgi:6-phosphogluconolactonase